MTLNNIRIRKLDDLNLTFDEYREVRNLKTQETTMKWIHVGGYYGNMKSCLEAIKNYIINSYANIDDYKEVLDKINELNNCIINCVLRCNE